MSSDGRGNCRARSLFRLAGPGKPVDERLYRNVLGAISHLAWHAGRSRILRRAQARAHRNRSLRPRLHDQ